MRPLVQPLITSLAALVFATSLVACGGDGSDSAGSGGVDTGSATSGSSDSNGAADAASPGDAAVARVQKALASKAAQLAGIDDPAKLAKATCTPVDDAFECLASGAPQQQAVRIELKADGKLAKKLTASTGALKTSADVANALSADDEARGVDPTAVYGCATSVRTAPDGTQQPGGATGYLCFGTGGTNSSSGAPQARYVEPGDDGALLLDYIVQAPAGG